ncbi:MAG: hypothetical protein EOP83_13255 [Verrucomicrobiaceae bacterium]|nr:MAG: hypothetical protein EOP83_13255 [Verrucomicrobiaceae bacterium]
MAQEAAVLPLDKRPTYQTLTAAGFKLRNSNAGRANPLQTTGYNADPCRILFGLGESRSTPFDFDENGSVGFQQHELTPPGPHYPPVLPVQNSTPVWTLNLGCNYPDLAAARNALASMEKMLKVDIPKVDAWIQHKLWESASALKLDATIPDATTDVFLYYQPKDETRGAKEEIRLTFQIQWNAPPSPIPQPGMARPPRPHVQPGQPAQSQQR